MCRVSCQGTVTFFVLMLCYFFRMLDDLKQKILLEHKTEYGSTT